LLSDQVIGSFSPTMQVPRYSEEPDVAAKSGSSEYLRTGAAEMLEPSSSEELVAETQGSAQSV